MPEIGTSGFTSGERKRTIASRPRTAPFLELRSEWTQILICAFQAGLHIDTSMLWAFLVNLRSK